MARKLRLLHCMIGVSLAIGLLVLLNQLQIPFYLYYPRVTHTVLISESYDLYFFLVSSLCVPSTLVSLRKLSKSVRTGIVVVWAAGLLLTISQLYGGAAILYATIFLTAVLSVSKASVRRFVTAEVITGMLPIFVLIEASTLYYWFNSAFNPQAQTGLLQEQLELNLTYSLFSVTIIVMLLLLFSWIPILLLDLRWRGRLVVRYQPMRTWNLRMIAATLDLFAIVTIVVFFYPYLNGQSWIVGVDSIWRYLNPLNNFAGLAPSEVIATSVEHGVYVSLLYLIEVVTSVSPFTIVKFAPLVLAFATASSVFFALRRGGWASELALLTALCVLLWFPTTLGIYAGLQANWVAFLLWMIFLAFYFQSKDWNAITYITQALISFAILVIHPWTWGVFLASLLITALICWPTALRTRCVQGVIASLIIALPVGAGANQIFPSLGIDWSNTIGLYTIPLTNPASLLLFGSAMSELFLNWGSFLPPLLLLVCLAGVYGLSRQHGIIRNYLVGWIIVWCIGSIMIAPFQFNPTNIGISETGLWRMLYVSPLPILLAIGVQKCLDATNRLRFSSLGQSSLSTCLVSAALVAASAPLVFSTDPLVRLIIVVGTVAGFGVIMIRYPNLHTVRLLTTSFLLLLLTNAAFRSLYPLLLDPHNLLGPIGAQ